MRRRPTPSATVSCTAAAGGPGAGAPGRGGRAGPPPGVVDPGAAPPAQVDRCRSKAVKAVYPDVPAVASFDTGVPRRDARGGHDLRPAARMAGALVPAALRLRRPLPCGRQRGGGSCWGSPPTAYRAGPATWGRAPAGRRRRGGSVDTTMGFTPLEALVMATRSGKRRPRAPDVAPGARRHAGPGDGGHAREPGRASWSQRGPPTWRSRIDRAAAGEAGGEHRAGRVRPPAARGGSRP